jgi:hypothetical protein
MRRRRFLRGAILGIGGAVLAPRFLADPHAPLPPRPAGKPVRVRGAVLGKGGGVGGVAVSDGLRVVRTTADGTYDLVTTDDRPFVQISVPAGYRIPTNPTGTARFHTALEPGDSGEAEAVFRLESDEKASDDHALLLLADIQTEYEREMVWHRERTVPDVRDTVRRLGGMDVFGVSCGDIVFDNLELYPEYERSVLEMGIPFFQVVGNHDLDFEAPVDEESTATFSKHFGPRYYSFERGAIHYVVLDDVFWNGTGYMGYLDRDQLIWLQADLAGIESGRTVVVFLHIPLLGSRHVREGERRPSITRSVTNREMLYRILEPYRAHVLAGHMHESEHLFGKGVHEHICGAVCGAWWSGPICTDGTPNGYAVYEIRGEEVTWRYKSVGESDDFQMRVTRSGDEVVANVWDWDPAWALELYQDGERRGRLRRSPVLDPLSVELHTGPRLPKRLGWVDPHPVDHLFRGRVSPGTRIVTVEATDRFGRVRTARLL